MQLTSIYIYEYIYTYMYIDKANTTEADNYK